MANSDKNIRITPNRNTTLFPKITFTGQSNNPITLNVLDDNSLSFEGSAGQLFSINNNLSSGYIFSINDISGLPSFRVNADGTVGIAEFFGNVGIGITNPAYKFQVRGDSYFASTGNTALLLLSGTGGTIIASNSVNITLTDPARKGLVIRAATSQSANILEWFPATGDGGYIRPTGEMVIGNAGTKNMSNGSTALLAIQGRGTTEGMLIRGFNSIASEVLFEIQGNPGNQLFGIYGDGGVNAPRINVTNGTASTSTTSGALVVTGGVGIGGSVRIGSALTVSDTTRLNSSLFNIPPTSSIGGTSGSLLFGTYWTGYQVENRYLIYGRQTVGGSIVITELTGAQVGGTTNIFGEFLKHFKWGRDKYVVLASTGNSVLYSTSPVGAGSSWAFATLPTTASWQRLEYGNDRFVAIATGSTAAYSLNGINWSLSSLPASIAWSDIKYGNGVFVAGAGSTVAYSYDGIDWSIASNNVAASNLTYGNGFFFANSTGNTASYSADGINWTNVTLPSDIHRGSAYGNGVFFNVGASSSNYISSDLINWTATANGVGSLSVPNSPWYVNNTFYYNQFAGSSGAFVAGPSGTLDLNPRFTGDINNVEIGGIKPAAAEFTTLAASGPVRFVSGLASTGFRNGSVVITGGVGIGGTLNVNNIGIGYTGIPYSPSIAFIGTTGDPIRLNVLSNNTLSFEGRSGQLFSINDNLSSGWIFSVNDISGIPLFRANADATISMAEYAGNVGIGLSNPTFKFQVAGSASIGATLNVNRLRVTSKITFEPGTGTSAVSGWTGIGLTSISKMIYAANRFVGVGGSYVAYSSDGVNFTYTTIPGQTSTASYGDIAYGNGVFVAVNAQNVTSTAYSYDGASWGTTSIATGINRTVVFGNGRFLSFSEVPSPIYSSTDGRNWTNIGTLGEYGREATFANGYYLTARGVSLYSSVNGINWKLANTPGSNNIHAITYGKGLYIAADYNSAQYYTSTDLVSWTQRSIDNRVWVGASYVNGVFYLIPNNHNAIYHSLDGINWSTTSFSPNIGGNSKLFTANDRLYFYSSVNSTLWSTDATTGTLMAKPFYNGELENTRIGAVNPDSATFTNLTALNPVTFTSATASTGTDNGALVVTGGVGIGGTTNLNTLRVNQDLVFTPTTGTTAIANGLLTANLPSIPGSPGNIRIRAVTFGNGRFVGGASTSIIWSDDAINWNRVNTPFTTGTAIQAIAYGNGTWIASSSTSTELIYSLNNGVTWNLTTIPNGNITDAVYGNGIFIISSGSYTGISTNGISWTTYTPAYYPHSFINGYFYSNSNRSADGYNWQALNIPVSNAKISYGNGMYFAAEYNSANYYYSYDGVNFATTTIGNRVHLNSAYYNGVYYLTTQHNNQVLRYSTDGFNYTDVVYPNGSANFAIAYGNNKIVLFNTLYTDITNYIYYAEASFGKANIQPFREGTIDNVTIGSRIPQAGTFNNVSVLKNLNVNSNFPSVSSNTGALTVLGGVGIGGTLNANSVVTYNRLQNQSFSGSSVGSSDGLMINFSTNYQYQSYGNGIYVASAAGANNAIYSTDGVTWQNTTLPVNQAYPINFYGNGYFVLSASGSTTVLYSTNGNSWSQVSIGNTFARTSGVYGNGKYIIVGSGSTYNYSTNLTTWNSATLPFNSDWYITYGNGMFVALGNGTRNLLYSYDGLNWSLGNVNTASGPWSGIKYGNGVFVASSYANPSSNTSGTIYSYDGINWSQGSISNQDFFNVSYGNGVYFGNNQNAYWTSTDGANWSSGVSFSSGFQSYQSAYAYNKFNTIGRFIDGPTNTVTIEPKFTGEINNVRIGAITPSSGDFTNLSSTGSANLVGTVNANNLNILSKVNQTPVLGGFAGTDGWTSAGVLAGPNNNYALAFGNGLFVQIRKTTNHTSFSSDGKRWIASTMPFTGEWNDLAWGKDKFVAVAGVGTTGAYSGNGISWTPMNMPSNADGWYKITYADEKYVAISSTGSTAAYSFDGISWSTSSMIASTNWRDITYGNGTFIAVSGTGRSAAYSYDGINWNLFNLPSSSGGSVRYVTYGNGLFISPPFNTSAVDYSRDGVNWSTTNITSGLHRPTVYGNGMYATFNYSNVHYSYDGLTWLVGNTIAATDWYAAEYGNNRFVATSINTTQVGSIDGPSNTLNLYPKFTGDIDNVRIGAKQPAAAEFTNLAAQQPVRFTANTPSTNTTNGALMVLGGVGIGGSLNIGSDVIINGGRESNSTSTGSLIVRGGVGITGGLYVSPFSSTGKGIVVASRASQSGNLFELQNSSLSTITSFNFLGDLNITSSTANTSATTGSIVTSGGVGIGGSVTINSLSQSTSTTNGALKVSGGVGISGNVNVGGSLNFSTSTFGGVSTSIVPTMTFIGQANDPITLSVLSDNSLSFDGSSGQLFSINNNLSTGWIFSISDISGLPLFRTNADGTVSMGEFGGNVGIGLTNPTFKLQVAGRASIGNTLFVTGNAHFGTSAYYDNYQPSYSPVVTITENFPGDIGLQIKNNSDDFNARSGVQIYNDANEYCGLYLGSSQFSGIATTSSAFLETFRYLEVSAGDGMLFKTGSGNIIDVAGTKLTVSQTTESTSTTTGSLIINGGAGIAKSVNIGGFLSSKPAYASIGLDTDQTLVSNTDNLILFTDNTDPNNWWTGTAAIGVSHRFKPNIAGTYFVAFQIHFKQTTGTGQMNIQARKNANTFAIGMDNLTTDASGRTLNATGMVSLDGNTDYIDFTAYTNSSGSHLITGEAARQYSQVVIYKVF